MEVNTSLQGGGKNANRPVPTRQIARCRQKNVRRVRRLSICQPWEGV